MSNSIAKLAIMTAVIIVVSSIVVVGAVAKLGIIPLSAMIMQPDNQLSGNTAKGSTTAAAAIDPNPT
jgi:hypothetical protein